VSREAIAERRVSSLLDRLQRVADARQHRLLLQRLVHPRHPTVLSFLNQHAFNLAWEQAEFGDLLGRSDVLLRDGVGVAVLLKLLGRAPGMNMNGTDLIPQILAAYRGRRVALVGTTAPYLEQAAQQLREAGANVVFVQDGFAEEDSYVGKLIAAEPELIVLGMGMPRQERFAASLAGALRRPALIVNGGAILDFLAGRFPRAPGWLRALRLEWLYRLAREPRRLWGRYVGGGGRFVRRLWRMAWRSEASAARLAGLDADAAQAGPEGLFDGDEAQLARLLQRVEASVPMQAGRIVQFAAVRGGEGASTIARGYAQACARLRGRRVLLLSDAVPGDGQALQRPLASPSASSQDGPGVTVAAPQAIDTDGSTARLADPAAWNALRQRFDEVVVDVGGPHGLLAAPHADGVVVVAQAEATPAAAAQRLLDDLAAANARVLGAVLNRQHSYLPRGLRERF